MKTKWIIEKLPVFALLLLLAGAWLLFRPKKETVYGITDGTYRMVTAENSGAKPFIHFTTEGKAVRFVFGADPRMSYAYRGTVELDGKVKVHVDNGGENWIFEVIDKDTIAFVQQGSSLFMGQKLPDGTIFQYVEE